MQIYVVREGDQRGPYSLEQVQQHLADGRLLITDSAWHKGLDNWIPLSEVPGVVVAPQPLPRVIRKPGKIERRFDELAGFWRRALALFTDIAILLFIFMLTSMLENHFFPALGISSWLLAGSHGSEWLILYGPEWLIYEIPAWVLLWVLFPIPFDYPALIGSLISAIYFIGFNAAKSATPGKMALGMRIVNAKTGKKPSVGRFVVRHISEYLSYLPFLLGYFWVVVDKRNQSFHDHIAGTVVVKAKRWVKYS